jgi:hypothetical protein
MCGLMIESLECRVVVDLDVVIGHVLGVDLLNTPPKKRKVGRFHKAAFYHFYFQSTDLLVSNGSWLVSGLIHSLGKQESSMS